MENAEFIFLGIKIADWLEIGAFVLAIFGLYYNTKERKQIFKKEYKLFQIQSMKFIKIRNCLKYYIV